MISCGLQNLEGYYLSHLSAAINGSWSSAKYLKILTCCNVQNNEWFLFKSESSERITVLMRIFHNDSFGFKVVVESFFSHIFPKTRHFESSEWSCNISFVIRIYEASSGIQSFCNAHRLTEIIC